MQNWDIVADSPTNGGVGYIPLKRMDNNEQKI